MSWRDAPLYVETQELAVWVLEHTARWSEGPARGLAESTAQTAVELVVETALALTFPGSRPEHLERLDQGIVRLRSELRLAARLGGLAPRQLRFAGERLSAIGCMVGGWRKRVARRGRRRERHEAALPTAAVHGSDTDTKNRGEGPPPAGV